METILSAYPAEVVREVTSVETGLQRTCKFPPRTAEIVEACDALVARNSRHERFRNWGRRDDPEPDLGPRLSREQLEQRYGGAILPPGFGESKLREPSGFKTGQAPFDKLVEHYRDNAKAKHLLDLAGRRKGSLA